MRLQEAQAELVAVSELAPDNRARMEAELAFKEAELNMRQAKDAREDADRAQQDAAKTGIEGTDAMISARNEEATPPQKSARTNRISPTHGAPKPTRPCRVRSRSLTPSRTSPTPRTGWLRHEGHCCCCDRGKDRCRRLRCGDGQARPEAAQVRHPNPRHAR